MRHDNQADLFAKLSKQVHRDVEIEPDLEPLTGELFERKTVNTVDDARSDVRIRGFWGNKQNAFFDFWVYYPFSMSYIPKTSDTARTSRRASMESGSTELTVEASRR